MTLPAQIQYGTQEETNMARLTVGGTDRDFIFAVRNGYMMSIPGTIRWYTAQTGGTQITDLLLNGQPVTQIPVGPDGLIPAHQWPDGVTEAWADAGAARVLYRRGEGSGVTATTWDDIADRPTIPGPSAEAPREHGEPAPGTSTSYARADHRHAMPSAADVGAAPASHNHPAAGISDSTATGRNLLTAADAAAARAALGVGPAPVRFSAATATIAATGSDRADVARTIVQARMRTATAPVGSALTVQVQHSTDGSSWSTIATLTIAAGSTAEAVSGTLSQAQSVGHLVRLNVTSVGSTTPATGVVADVIVQ